MCEICNDASTRTWSHARTSRHRRLLIKKMKEKYKAQCII